MSTTNLISKSLGDVLLESGNGTPDHISPKGSLYVDQDSGVAYQNKNNATAWAILNSVAYGEGYYQNNATQTTISTVNTWVAVGNTLIAGTNRGFSANTSTLVVLPGYDGKYEVRGDVTIEHVGGTPNFEVGLSINGAVPVAGTYNGNQVDATFTRQHIGFSTIANLVGGDTLQFGVRNITGTNNVIIRHAGLFIRKNG